MEMSNFTSVTDNDFNQEVTRSDRPVLVYFWRSGARNVTR